MFKSFFLAGCIVWVRISLFAQTGELPPLKIPEVTIIQSNRDYFSDENPTLSLDQVQRFHKDQNLGYLLEHESQVMIRTYGAEGSLVSLSLHGTGSNHTQVSWNGFSLNSPTTGQADLSIIPSSFMHQVEVISGASGVLFGSGTFGGSISLGNKPDWNNRLHAEYNSGAGSFGSFGNNLQVRLGNSKFQYHLALILDQAENNFTYKDYYKYKAPLQIATHNAYAARGIIQNLYFSSGNGHYLEAGIWYQQKYKEMPALMGYYHPNNAIQRDSLLRTYLNYRKSGEKSVFSLKTAWFSDFIHYTDKINADDQDYSINSGIAAGRLMNEADYRYYLSPVVTLGGGTSMVLASGRSANYGGRIREQDYAVYGNIRLKYDRWIMNSGVRKEFYNGINPPLQYSLGFRYKAGNRLILRSDVSSKFRKPTFNEKYWIPGGNPLLHPEKGWGGEAGAEWNIVEGKNQSSFIQLMFTGYFQHVDNWIQWVMRDSLTPAEYKKVHAGGLESRLNYHFSAGSLRIFGFMAYSYNRSVIVSTYDHNPAYANRQMMYVPKHSGKLSLMGELKSFTAGCYVSCTGSRETVETEDASTRLNPFALVDLAAGYNHTIYGIEAALYLHIDNLMNKQYEVIRSYPNPGRSFHVTITLGIDRKISQ